MIMPKLAPKNNPDAPSESLAAARPKQDRTVIWGEEVEKGDYVIVPRALLRMGRYDANVGKTIMPRHTALLLAMASRRFKKKKVRAYWEELGDDLGVKPGTARKWGYELRELGLVNITQHRGRDPVTNKPGIRNERNSFDISPFVAKVESAFKHRKRLCDEFREKKLRRARDEQ